MFQGVQSPWLRPNARSRSPNARRDPARGGALLLAAGGVDPAEQPVPPGGLGERAALDRRPEGQLARGLRRRLGRDVRAAAHGGDDRGDGHPAPVAGMQHLGRGERRRRRRGQVAERHRLGGDQLAGQVVPADLGVRDHAPVRRRDLHDGLAVRPGCSDAHREIGPGQVEDPGEVVRQDEAGQVGVADARGHRDRRPPADEPLSHAGPQSAGRGRGGEPGASRCPIGELCDRRGRGTRRSGRREDLRPARRGDDDVALDRPPAGR